MADGWAVPHCPSGGPCVHWVQRYLRDCVCGVKDELSVAFGLISVFSWGVAEVPQIFTNFMSHSTEGVSLGFLMTWVVGDLFNLVGCLLEPATLPTQFYTAMLYTITTVILVLQTICYGHICKWWKVRKTRSTIKKQPCNTSKESDQNYEKEAETVNMDVESKKNSVEIPKSSLAEGTLLIPSLPIPATGSPWHKDLYYTSARSLASSHTPTTGSYLLGSRNGSGRSGPSYTLNQSSVEDQEGLLTNYLVTASPMNTKNTLLSAVVGTTFFISGLNLHLHAHNTVTSHAHVELMQKGFVIHSQRKLLQEISGVTFKSWLKADESISALGTYLGWLMAAIYMSGRLPQIYLNIKRGTVEGLNPLMFMFALIGNVTYVGSIIVRTMDWERIKPNMPWLVDAAVCVLLDCFILAQFIYYQTQNAIKRTDDNGDYEEAKQNPTHN